jgi:hypothetical protein
MRLLSWNIQQGGGARTGRIIDALVSHDPDLIALSEFRIKPGVADLQCGCIESTNPAGATTGCACSPGRRWYAPARVLRLPKTSRAGWTWTFHNTDSAYVSCTSYGR